MVSCRSLECLEGISTGRGVLYKYDALGSVERIKAACAGKGESMMQPLLDSLSGMNEDDGMWTTAGKTSLDPLNRDKT